MKSLLYVFFIAFLALGSFESKAQLTFSSGATPYTVYLLPFTPACLNMATANATAISITGTFQFTSAQCCACPSSGSIVSPGSVAYGGPGSSAQFDYYHTLSYSSSNEHQQITFSAPVNVFQFSTSGQGGAPDQMSAQVFNGATLLGTFNFMTAGPGNYNTFNIVHTGIGFTRVSFVEIGAVNADDELLGDFFINDELIALSPNSMNFNAAIEESDDSHALLTWNGLIDEHIEHFELFESTDGLNWSLINEQNATNTSNYYVFKSPIRSNVQYYYKLDSYNENMNLVGSQTRELKKLDYNLMVYPNPTNDGFFVTSNGEFQKNEIILIDMLGKEISISAESSNLYSTVNLANGMYMLKGTNQKIIVQH